MTCDIRSVGDSAQQGPTCTFPIASPPTRPGFGIPLRGFIPGDRGPPALLVPDRPLSTEHLLVPRLHLAMAALAFCVSPPARLAPPTSSTRMVRRRAGGGAAIAPPAALCRRVRMAAADEEALAAAPPPKRPSPDAASPALPTPPSRSAPVSGLNAPPDASSVRTESQRRRNAPVKPLGRRRRRGGASSDAADGDSPAIDWEALESVPLVGAGAGREASKSGKNYWVDVADAAKADARRAEARRTAEARAAGVTGVDEELKEKLKKEVVSPYTNNWIGIAVLAVLGLVLAAQLLGTESPVIQIPDL